MTLAPVNMTGRSRRSGGWLGHIRPAYIGFALLTVAFPLAGCVQTHLTRVQDPDYRTKVHRFQHPAVFADAADLAQRKLIEDVMVSELSARRVAARASIELLPPTRDYAPRERSEALLAAGVDSVILISGESGVEQVYVPVSGSTTTTDGSMNFSGSTAYYRETSQTRYQGGYTIAKPWSKITTRVVDLRTGRTAWLGDAETQGSGFSTFDDVHKSYARTVANQLQSDLVFAAGAPRANKAVVSAPWQRVIGWKPQATTPARAPTRPSSPKTTAKLEERSLATRLEGCVLAGDDGHFLGKITRKTDDAKGILNAGGEYGNEGSPSSIFNRHGAYGSADSPLSAFNATAATPPSIFCGERFEAYATTNGQKSPAIDTRLLAATLRAAPDAQCANDMDCGGDFVCENHHCVVFGAPSQPP
jgi:hypothetical protein